jgi:hypothetical protein
VPGEVDIALEPGVACAFEQAKQRRALRGPRLSSDDDHDPVMWLTFGQLDEVVPVTCHQEATVCMRELKDDGIHRVRRPNVAQPQDLVAKFLEEIGQIAGYVVVEQELHG